MFSAGTFDSNHGGLSAVGKLLPAESLGLFMFPLQLTSLMTKPCKLAFR